MLTFGVAALVSFPLVFLPLQETKRLDPLLDVMLKSPVPRGGILFQSPIVEALKSLLSRQGLKPDDYLQGWVAPKARTSWGAAGLSEARAVRFATGQTTTVVAILGHGYAFGAPPYTPAWQLLLFDANGRVLDRLTIITNIRYGGFKTVVPEKAEAEVDGAQIIIQFQMAGVREGEFPERYSYGWYVLGHKDEAYTFYEHEKKHPFWWWVLGVSRLKIEKDKFVLITPELGKSDRELIEEMEKKSKP